MRPIFGVLLAAGLAGALPGCHDQAACDARLATMRATFAKMPTDPYETQYRLEPGMELPTTTAAGKPVDGIPIFVDATGRFRFDNQEFELAGLRAAFGDEVDKARTLADNTGRPWNAHAILVIDRRAPIADVVALIDEAPPGVSFVQVLALAGDTIPAPPPAPAWVEPALKPQVDVDSRQSPIVDAFVRANGSCTALIDVFAGIADVPADDRARYFAQGVPEAVARCNCGDVDIEALTALAWHKNGQHNLRTRMLPIAHADGAAPLALPRGATGQDLAALVERAPGPYRLTLAPPT